ncbi:MAG: hypothetical protein HYS05_01045 [Acidobacteria bacterium]|nr:hypothetical protein [Acidobacteriota bacterium]
MEQTAVSDLKRTPLHTRHLAHGARMAPFGGWDMPVEYTGIVEEHLAVRTRAGLFDVSHMGQIEVAGDRALEAVQHLCSNDASRLKIGQAQYSALTTPTGCFVDDLLVFAPPHAADRLWNAIIDAGRPSGLIPVGLGARDTLRLEAAMRLYGNDIDETTSVLEADLGWVIAWQKPAFNGRDALAAQKERGVDRKLVGLEMLDRAIARHGYDVLSQNGKVGAITSGTQTPFLKKAIAMAYVRADTATEGTVVEVDVRGRRTRAQVVPLPFYKRPKN